MTKFWTLFPFLAICTSAIAQLDFSSAVPISSRLSPSDQTIGDFDNNGLKDIAYSTGTTDIYVLYNQGNKKYSESVLKIPSNAGLFLIESADFNEDGKYDLAIINNAGNTGTQRVFIALSSGTTFNLEVISSVPFVRTIQVLDFNNDGHSDILLTPSIGNFSLLTGDGDGKFSQSYLTNLPSGNFSSTVTDLNKDGLIDLVIGSSGLLDTYIQNSGFQFVKNSATVEGTPQELISADFNGDGFHDLVYSTTIVISGIGTTSLRYFLNDGTGKLNITTNSLTSQNTQYVSSTGLTQGDYDKDGRPDVIVSTFLSSNPMKIYHNNGNNDFSLVPISFGLNADIRDIDVADLENDGSVEIIELSRNHLIDIYSYSSSAVNWVQQIILGFQPLEGKVADINKDGNMDVITSAPNNGVVSIQYGLGNFEFKAPIYFQATNGVYAVETGDFNSDNFEDIIYVTPFTTTNLDGVQIVLSNSVGELTQRKLIALTQNGWVLTRSDFNKDGKLDFATNNAVYLGDGNGNFTTKPFSIAVSSFKSIAAGDLNNDSFPDLAINDGLDIYFSINDGQGGFTTFSKYISTTKFLRPKKIDFNGDTFADFVALKQSGQGVVILKNKGNLEFEEINIPITNAGVFGSADMVDFNNDGLGDIVVGFSTTAGGSLLGVSVFTQDGTGNFQSSSKVSSSMYNSSSVPNFVVAADLNNDNKKDIICFALNGVPIWATKNELVTKPTIDATSVTASNITAASVSISLQKGNGNGRLLVIRKNTSTQSKPVDGVFYSTNLKFGVGTDLGSLNFAIASSDLTQVDITGLEEGTAYSVSAFEYNVNPKNTIINYLTATFGSATFTTKKSQIISPLPVITKTEDDAPFTINAVASSSLPVAVQLLSGNVSLSDVTISILGPGPVSLKLSQTGNAEFSPAPAIDYGFCVNPVVPKITSSIDVPGKYTLTSSSDKNNNWYRNATAIPGATNKTYEPLEDGVYTVKVDYAGCVSTSLPTANLITGIPESDMRTAVYPNPASNQVWIEMPEKNTVVKKITLYDLLGKVTDVDHQLENDILNLNLRDLSSGIYYILIQTEHRQFFFKILKNHG